ncbi:MAG: DNA translocase FtsK 4TM domain-containing protein [candidate division WOR-3 bacterium]
MERRRSKGREQTTALVTKIALLVVLLFAAVSLGSYLLGQKTVGTNYGGILGHYLALGLWTGLGWAAVMVPILGLVAWFIALGRKRGWRRFAGFGLIILGIFLWASLVSFQTGAQLVDGNFGGWLGATLARYLSAWFGLAGYTLVALFGYWGFALWFRRPKRQDILQSGFILLLGLIFDILLGQLFPYPAAGSTGTSLARFLKELFGGPGSLILLFALLAVLLAVWITVCWPRLSLGEVLRFGWLQNGLTALIKRVKGTGRKGLPVVRTSAPADGRAAPTAVGKQEEKQGGPVGSEPVTAESEQPPESAGSPETGLLRQTVRHYNTPEFQQAFLDSLDQPTEADRIVKDAQEAQAEAQILLDKLKQFGIEGRITEILSGPMITRFELEPAPGVKIQRIESLADDIALALSAERIRILAPIPGKSAVGVEVPNKARRTVLLREVLLSDAYRAESSPLGFALGTTITGEPYSADLRTMPHILIAGTTGSGKSVCINSIIMSIIFRSSPQEVRFLTIDPKQLELPLYNPIPHLLSPTTVDPKRAVDELTRVVGIMETRYGEFASIGVRDIAAYNARAHEEGFAPKPYIVVVVDELADLMLRAPNEIEERIIRLAQMSRAVGIHLILATQRPSVDVITGLIKANFPCRVAFQVASKTDSRTILDMNGAEALLGRGDMLFLPPGKGEPVRLHGAFVSERACKRVVELWTVEYLTTLLTGLVASPAEKARQLVELDVVDVLYDPEKSSIKKKMEALRSVLSEEAVESLMAQRYHEPLPEELELARERESEEGDLDELDEKFAEAARIVVRYKVASVSMLQRKLKVGWARAGRMIEQMERVGIVGPYAGSQSRSVLIDSESDLETILGRLGSRSAPARHLTVNGTPEGGTGQ